MKEYLEVLNNVIHDSQTLSKIEFEERYKGNPIEIILSTPIVFNDSMTLYRCRLAKNLGKDEDLSSSKTFSYVPLAMNEKGIPQMGRANYKGQSIFYASEHLNTNFKEISKESCIDDEAYIAKWSLKPNTNLHLYCTIPDWGIGNNNISNSIFTITHPEIINSDLGTYLKYLGSIMMYNGEIGKYFASSYIANCIYTTNIVVKSPNGEDLKIYYDGIIYPSVKGGAEDVNFALKPEVVDHNLELECVIKGKLDSDMKSVKFQRIGINECGRITWYESFIDESSITNIKATFYNSSNDIIDTSKGKITNDQCVMSEMSAIAYIFKKNRNQVFEELYRKIDLRIKETQTICRTTLEKNFDMEMQCILNGWKLVNEKTETPICKIVYNFTLKNKLRGISSDEVRQ